MEARHTRNHFDILIYVYLEWQVNRYFFDHFLFLSMMFICLFSFFFHISLNDY